MKSLIFGTTMIAKALVMELMTNYLSLVIWICLKYCLLNYSSSGSLLESLGPFADRNSFTSLKSDRLDEASTSLLTNVSHISTPKSKSSLSSHGIEQTDPKATSTP